jgi:ketosteroid isomerase-like protein
LAKDVVAWRREADSPIPRTLRYHFRMKTLRAILLGAAMLLAAGCSTPPARSGPAPDLAALRAEVVATERAFARTMADRDFAAFSSFIADDAVFFSGPKTLRGKAEITAAWKKLYEKKDPPFSWAPEHVEVQDSGLLALSTGPVRDPAGKLAGTFTSVWRQAAPGTWQIIFDKGDDACECKAP